MSNIVIKVENLSKAYQLGQIGTGTISRDLERWYARMLGKEDPFLRIGERHNQNAKSESDLFWSLKDINFEIEQGDAVGIIGRNGAGKSTLLKILSKVTAPTTGKISGKGRIASLLEVGTGFHPELSGRENIFLNGAILGMRKKEIQRKLEEIVDFAGIERYLDTPVKRYSSGMYVRLAFAVAAHLESEILIVDEVLAVGDAEFQKKCLGKMGEVSKGEGRTVLFVSHNMGAIKALCQNLLLLDHGKIFFSGQTDKGIAKYLTNSINKGASYLRGAPILNCIVSATVLNKYGETEGNFAFEDEIYINLIANIQQSYKTAYLSLRITNSLEQIIFTTEKSVENFIGQQKKIKVTIPGRILLPNNYTITIALHIPNIQMIEALVDILSFTVTEIGSDFFHYAGSNFGCVNVKCNWDSI